jgi:hypothetical protein
MSDIPRYTITHGDVTVEAVVAEIDGKRIVQPVDPPVVLSGESFTISSEEVISVDWA